MIIKELKTAKKYNVIYADPPWSYEQGGRGAAKNHYKTMTVEDIKKLPVNSIASDNALLFMWATFPNISAALDVIKAWGFIYKTAAFVWVKKNKSGKGNFWGMGAYTRANAEICLLGIRQGVKASEVIVNHGIHQIIEAPIGIHSAKPTETRDRIEKLVGGGSLLEMFARNDAPGWDCWGDEL